jgi:hypothetical protein
MLVPERYPTLKVTTLSARRVRRIRNDRRFEMGSLFFRRPSLLERALIIFWVIPDSLSTRGRGWQRRERRRLRGEVDIGLGVPRETLCLVRACVTKLKLTGGISLYYRRAHGEVWSPARLTTFGQMHKRQSARHSA